MVARLSRGMFSGDRYPKESPKELSESLDNNLGLCYNSVSVEHSSIGKDFWFSSRQEQFDSAMLYHIIFGAVYMVEDNKIVYVSVDKVVNTKIIYSDDVFDWELNGK